MNKRDKVQFVINELEKLYPKTPVPLNHHDPFTLLIAVLLSAQCTDERVNKITPILFKKADNPFDMVKLSVEEIKASLDVLFSLYYGVVKECSSTRFLQLAKTFDQKVFSKIPHKCTEVINLAPSMAEQMETAVTFDIRARCAIILIVAVDLERIVHTFTSGQGSGEAQHHLLSSVVQVTTVLSQTTDTVESGAVKLAWAAFLSLAKSMITGISQADEQAMTAFLSASDVASGLDSLKNIAMNSAI